MSASSRPARASTRSALDEVHNRPFNPMVNAGAIATAELIEGDDAAERAARRSRR